MSEKSCEKCESFVNACTRKEAEEVWGHRSYWTDLAEICKYYAEKPEPSEFEKAWSHWKHQCATRMYYPMPDDFKAGWNARGEASNRVRIPLVKYHKGCPYYQFAAIEQMESKLNAKE